MIPLIHENRGDVVENIHFGRICVVDENRNVVHAVGDCRAMTYFRSASKPIQALPVLYRRLDEKYGFTDNEIAIMCASHMGQQFHLDAILSMLKKTGIREEEFIMLPAYPAAKADRDHMVKNQIPPRKALHNCSGKHVATMVLAKELTGSTEGYWKLDHPAQQEILDYISLFSEYPRNEIKIGVDGCGVPVFAVPLQNIAISFMKLACPDTLENDDLKNALVHIQNAVNSHSPMIRGTDQVDDVFNRDKNIIAKCGAQGVYAFGMKEERQGISFKLEDGPGKLWPVMVGEILKQLSYKNNNTIDAVDGVSQKSIFNDNKEEVGVVTPVFRLS